MPDQNKRLSILFCASNHWEHPAQVGSHHLARALTQAGYRVAFVGDPISPWHLLIGNDMGNRLTSYWRGGAWHLEGRLWSYTPMTLLPPARYPLFNAPQVLKSWHRLAWPSPAAMLARHGFKNFAAIYVDSLRQARWWRGLPYGKCLLRLSDNLAGFGGWNNALQNSLSELAGHVDMMAYTSPTLKPQVDDLRPRHSFYLPNGVAAAMFASPAPKPAEYAQINKPIAVYVGAMEQWFDYVLLNQLTALADWLDFVLIGPPDKARARLEPRSNLHILGTRPHRLLPGYLQHARLGIIPFAAQAFPELVSHINPLKLLEYMAAGLPVASADWLYLRQSGLPVTLCRNLDDWLAVFRQCLERDNHSSQYQETARQYDWELSAAKLLLEMGLPERGEL